MGYVILYKNKRKGINFKTKKSAEDFKRNIFNNSPSFKIVKKTK